MSDDQVETKYLTRKFKLGHRDLAQKLRERAAYLWNVTVNEFYKNKGEEITESEMKKRVVTGHSDDYQMSSKSMQLVVKQFYDNFEGWWQKEQSDTNYENNKPPHKEKNHFAVYWTYQEISTKDGHIILSNGNHEEGLCIEWGWATKFDIKRACLTYDKAENEFEVHIQVEVPVVDEIEGSEVAAIDPGEVHPMCVFDGEQVYLFKGGELRSKFQYLEKIHAEYQKKLSRKERGSKRRQEMLSEYRRKLSKVRKQIREILHKYSMRLVDTLRKQGVSTVVLGELTGIREGLDYGPYINQKLHQWCFSRLQDFIRYKAELRNMNVQKVDEYKTSSLCPKCRSEFETDGDGRESFLRCGECGFSYHRDGIGAINIWYRWHEKNDCKYPAHERVVGDLASPRVIRYDPEMTCVSSSGRKTAEILRLAASETKTAA